VKGIKLTVEDVQTNIVTFTLEAKGMTDELFLNKLRENHVWALAQSKNKIRLVTHYGIRREHVETALAVIEDTMRKSGR
jgi:threonine aldolase